MHSIDDFILEIKKKREFLQHLEKTTTDSSLLKKISSSLLCYIEMEYYLSQLNIFIDDDSKKLTSSQSYINKMYPYLMREETSNYLLEHLDLEYRDALLNILSESYSFSIPSLEIYNQELMDLTKIFYNQAFHNPVLQEVINILEHSHILFLENESKTFPFSALGTCYMDSYYDEAYIFIHRYHNMSDFVSLPHEIFHGLHFKLNPNIKFSVSESLEVGPHVIEYLYYDFLFKNSIYGDILKMIHFISMSNNATLIKKTLSTDFKEGDIISNFLLLEAQVIGYGMAKEYLMDSKETEQKLMKYIYHHFPLDHLPDYRFLRYSKEEILKTGKQLVKERNELLDSNFKKSL